MAFDGVCELAQAKKLNRRCFNLESCAVCESKPEQLTSDLVTRHMNFPNPIQLVARNFIVGKSVLSVCEDSAPVALAYIEDLIVARIDK